MESVGNSYSGVDLGTKKKGIRRTFRKRHREEKKEGEARNSFRGREKKRPKA